jgi:hypothetical protein
MVEDSNALTQTFLAQQQWPKLISKNKSYFIRGNLLLQASEGITPYAL